MLAIPWKTQINLSYDGLRDVYDANLNRVSRAKTIKVARLIAAAPELLAAAEVLLAERRAWDELFIAADNILYDGYSKHPEDGYPKQTDPDLEALRQAFLKLSESSEDGWNALELAQAKATGGEHGEKKPPSLSTQ